MLRGCMLRGCMRGPQARIRVIYMGCFYRGLFCAQGNVDAGNLSTGLSAEAQ